MFFRFTRCGVRAPFPPLMSSIHASLSSANVIYLWLFWRTHYISLFRLSSHRGFGFSLLRLPPSSASTLFSSLSTPILRTSHSAFNYFPPYIFFHSNIFSLNFFIFLPSLRFTLYILRTRWFLLTITCPGYLSVPVYITPTHTLVKHRLSTLFRLFVFSFLSAFCPT